MRRVVGFVFMLGVMGVVLAQGPGLTVKRDAFDGRQLGWTKGPASVPYKEDAHALTQQHAHSSPSSEYVKITAEPGNRELNSYIQYVYPTPPAPIGDETAGTVWVRAGRPGVQLWARAVLPKERDPRDPSAPLSVLLPGERYQLAGGRWQRLEVRKLTKALADERQRLRVALGRDVDISGAFVDQLLLNLFTGPGTTEVWIDDLEISPVVGSAEREAPPAKVVSRSKEATAPPPPGVKAVGPVPVEFQRDQLRVGGKPIIFRGIRHTDTPLKTLRDAGLNTLIFPGPAPAAVCEEAARYGFWLMPTVPIDSDTESVTREVSRFIADDAVLAWYLGDWRHMEQLDGTIRTAAAIRAADPQRPIAADVRDGFWSFSRHVDLIGAHRWPLFTSLEMTRYRDWMQQRHKLARPNSFLWSWVQTHLPDWYIDVLQPPQTPGGFAEPVGPHPEQIRLLTYLSIAAGARGIAYYSDRALADAQQGRDRLLGIALLNQEIAMLEPLLVTALDSPAWIDTTVPQVKAAVLRCERGVLVLPMWLGEGTQFVPEQGAAARVTMTVPQVPVGTQAWSVRPGDVHAIEARRVVGGTEITLREFDHTAAIVFTADTSPTGLLVKWQDQNRKMAPSAAQWTYDLANVTIAKVQRVQSQLTQLGVAIPEAEKLMQKVNEHMTASKAAFESGDYRNAYQEAQRAQRPLRVLARAQWLQLVRGLDMPTSAPYAVSYYSLPQHVQFIRQLNNSVAGNNLLPDGDFENGQGHPAGWNIVRNTIDEVELTAALTNDVQAGRHSLRLDAKPKQAPAAPDKQAAPPPAALERTFLAAESQPVRLTPGSLAKISFWVKVPLPIQASADGLVIYDSGAGEPLGIRITAPVPAWKQFTLYRKVPASGELRVVAALTGLGTVLLDDVRVEPMNPK